MKNNIKKWTNTITKKYIKRKIKGLKNKQYQNTNKKIKKAKIIPTRK